MEIAILVEHAALFFNEHDFTITLMLAMAKTALLQRILRGSVYIETFQYIRRKVMKLWPIL